MTETEEDLLKQTSDDILVDLARSGDLGAIDALIDRYYNICFRICMTILGDQDHASDACQNCFLKIIKNINKYRGDGSFRGWALTIARNESLGFLRRVKLRKEVVIEGEVLYAREGKPGDISGDVIIAMEASRVRKAFTNLPEKQRLTVQLRIDDGLSFREIGRVIGSSEGSARGNYYHGIRKLRKILKS
jgi:RNA polymerase sigma-70 factor (ECF subfamily)